MSDPIPSHSIAWLEPDFIRRVFRTSAVLVVLVAALLWELLGAAVVVGWLLGTGLSLAMLAGSEYSVRQLLAKKASPGRLVGLLVAKMMAAVGVLLFALWGARQGWVSLLSLCAGFALPQAVILLKLMGQRLRAAMGQEAGPPR
jgi:hypothetical protein